MSLIFSAAAALYGNIIARTPLLYLLYRPAATKSIGKMYKLIASETCGILVAMALARGLPDFPATDALTAIAVGIVSGLAATGANQVGKQLAAKQ